MEPLLPGRLTEGEAIGTARDASRPTRTTALTLAYWFVWVCAGVYVLQWPNLAVLSVWWLILAALWLTADLVRPQKELTGPVRWVLLLLVAVAGSLLMYWSAAWFLKLVSGVQLGGIGVWTFTSFAVQGLLVACLTALAMVPPLQGALGRASPPILAAAAAFASLRLFGHWLFSLRPWIQHAKGITVAIFELLALCLIPPALAVLRQATRKSKPAASHLLARLWRGELPARSVILGIYPMTLAVMILSITGSFWKLADDIPRWHQSYFSAVAWISTWILCLAGSVVTLRTLHRARTRRPWRALAGQLCVVLLSGYFLNITLHFYAVTAGAVFLESTPAFFGQPYQLRLSADGQELELSGDIDPGMTDALTDSLSKHPTVRRIRLDSGGGLLEEAEDAASLIHAHRLDTVVSTGCSSACTVIFVAGIHRRLDTTGQLGFHALQSARPDADIYFEQSIAYAPYDTGKAFLQRVAQVPPGSIWYPTRPSSSTLMYLIEDRRHTRQGALSADTIAGVNVFTKKKASTAVEGVTRDCAETFALNDRRAESHVSASLSRRAIRTSRNINGSPTAARVLSMLSSSIGVEGSPPEGVALLIAMMYRSLPYTRRKSSPIMGGLSGA